jgi:hypothetical protein
MSVIDSLAVGGLFYDDVDIYTIESQMVRGDHHLIKVLSLHLPEKKHEKPEPA